MHTPANTGNGRTQHLKFPAPATYRFANRVEPVIVLGLAPRGELRIVDRNGVFRTVSEHRVRLERAS